MNLYDKHFIHKVWDESLRYKYVLPSNDLKEIRNYIKGNYGGYTSVYPSDDKDFPFKVEYLGNFKYVYYDPYRNEKLEYYEGTPLEVKIKGKWVDVKNDKFKWNREYRIKVSSADNSIFETNIYEMNEDKTKFDKIMEFLRKILKSKNS